LFWLEWGSSGNWGHWDGMFTNFHSSKIGERSVLSPIHS
jgi:hypothetical protein